MSPRRLLGQTDKRHLPRRCHVLDLAPMLAFCVFNEKVRKGWANAEIAS
jgi:hemerythrin superfamily protein